LIRLICDTTVPVLNSEVLQNLVSTEAKELIGHRLTFPERTAAYVSLANISSILGDESNHLSLLTRAARNLLGYGFHKDMYFVEVLRGVEVFGIKKVRNFDFWIAKLGSISANISKLTDGDHTRYFQENYAVLLGRTDLKLLLKYYFDLQQNEKLFLCDAIFPTILSFLKESSSHYLALSRSCASKRLYAYLKETPTLPEHKIAIDELEALFGTFLADERPSTNSPNDYQRESLGVGRFSFEQLKEKIEGAAYPAQKGEIVLEWLVAQLSEATANRAEIAKQAIGLMKTYDIDHNRDLLLRVVPLAIEFVRDDLFDLLCMAHKSVMGWTEFGYSLEDAKVIWSYLKDHCKDRYLEFFKKTLALPERQDEALHG
jgi:hypothetical protein